MSKILVQLDEKMVQDKILTLFFEEPNKDFHIREIARRLKIPKSTISYNIKKLIKEKLIIKEKKQVFPTFTSNQENELYKFLKKYHAIKNMIKSGLLDHIEKETNPRCIILFGSFSKVEYDKNSDVDLFVQAKDQRIDLSKFEKKLNHKINILFETEINSISSELLNNIINGTKLRGFLKIRCEK